MFDFVVDVYALFCRLLADLASLWCDRFCIQWLWPSMDVLEHVINTIQYNICLQSVQFSEQVINYSKNILLWNPSILQHLLLS
jgi:hypothetical protein